jgi:hypothetical protein
VLVNCSCVDEYHLAKGVASLHREAARHDGGMRTAELTHALQVQEGAYCCSRRGGTEMSERRD